jgi:gentisate 1,2-dioxygenase
MVSTAVFSEVDELDPTVAAPVVNLAQHGFEGRFEDWTGDARYFEYSAAANPLASGHTSKVPAARFGRELYQDAPTGIIPLDLSRELGIKSGPATSPGLLASFIRIRARERVSTSPNATSQLYYVLEGRGFAAVNGQLVQWEKGDFLTLPAASRAAFHADSDAALYWVHDEPLLRHLGAEATNPKFRATRFPRARAVAELEEIASRPTSNDKSRVSVLLANAEEEQTLTITHVLWAMFGLLPAGQEQRPHRHQSVALDLILDARPGCYTLLGSRLDARGDIIDPARVDWEAGCAFVTPPGLWHAHYNESGAPAHLIPVQDAGLQTYLRSLDIRFTPRR